MAFPPYSFCYRTLCWFILLAFFLNVTGCASTVKSEKNAELENRFPSQTDNVYPPPTASQLLPLKVGQWRIMKNIESNGEISYTTTVITGKEGGLFWMDMMTETAKGTVTVRSLIQPEGNLPVVKSIERAFVIQDGKSVEYPSGMLHLIQRVFGISSEMGLGAQGPQEDVVVPAGHFKAAYRIPYSVKTFIGKQGEAWWHPEVPFGGLIKGQLGGLLLSSSRFELVAFGHFELEDFTALANQLGNVETEQEEKKCFPPSDHESTNWSVGFGLLAERYIEHDYCDTFNGCPRDDTYFDSPKWKKYRKFLVTHNPQQKESIEAEFPNVKRPDMMSHWTDLKEYYEIKPRSKDGISAGRKKIIWIGDFVKRNKLPYISGVKYKPFKEIPVGTFLIWAHPVKVSLDVQQLEEALVSYEVCLKANFKSLLRLATLAVILVMIVAIIFSKPRIPVPADN